mgnify:CR=1 FL=1|jgi:hypothetical protein
MAFLENFEFPILVIGIKHLQMQVFLLCQKFMLKKHQITSGVFIMPKRRGEIKWEVMI